MNNSWECLSRFLPPLYWFAVWTTNQSAFSHYWHLLTADADLAFSIGSDKVWQGQLVPTAQDTLGPTGTTDWSWPASDRNVGPACPYPKNQLIENFTATSCDSSEEDCMKFGSWSVMVRKKFKVNSKLILVGLNETNLIALTWCCFCSWVRTSQMCMHQRWKQQQQQQSV